MLGVGVCPTMLKLAYEYKNSSFEDIKFPINDPARLTVYCCPKIMVVDAEIVTTACGVIVGVAVNVGVGVLVNVGVIVGEGTRQLSKLSIDP